MSSMDISQCLQGLKLAYRGGCTPEQGNSRVATPTHTRRNSKEETEIEDEGGLSSSSGRNDEKNHRKVFYSSNSSIEQEVDPDIMERMSLVETQLLKIFHADVDDDEEQDAVRKKPLPAAAATTAKDNNNVVLINPNPHSFPCKETYVELPSNPNQWPQRPLMIRPTPYTTTKIRGIRRSKSNVYEHFPGFCAGCILPINSGSESIGNSLVIDFESSHFIGTLLLRIKQAPKNKTIPHNNNNNNDDSSSSSSSPPPTSSYFDGKKRKFQAIVKGRFKTPLPMSQCVTGQSFTRPAGKLPARWIVTSFVKFVSTLAPQLEATLDGEKPRFLSPLVATAHTVLVTPLVLDSKNIPICAPTSSSSSSNPSHPSHPSLSNGMNDTDHPHNLEEGVQEPPSVSKSSILAHVQQDLDKMGMTITDTTKSSLAGRMKIRKKTFNSIAAQKSVQPCFALDKEYTFEFYQHLLDFGDELAIDMGRPIGRVGLSSATDGQPIKFMSAHQDPKTNELNTLWSFDIWHESLYSYAENALSSPDSSAERERV